MVVDKGGGINWGKGSWRCKSEGEVVGGLLVLVLVLKWRD